MRSAKALLACSCSVTLAALGLAGCDDGATTTSSSGSTSSSSTGAGGGGGGGPACGASLTPAALDGGAWDTRFTVAGFTDHDGIAPRVNDFALDGEALLAVGRFRDHEGKTVTPFMRLEAGAWKPARASWELPLPADGFQAIAKQDGGALALATAAASFPGAPKSGEIWLEKSAGAGLEVIGTFDGQVRTIAWRGDELWVAGSFQLGSGVMNLAVWSNGSWSAPMGGGASGPVYDLAVVPAPGGARVHVAGAFASVGGVAAKNVATFDGAVWTARDMPDALAVFAIAETTGGDLYAGGALGGFEVASGLSRWDGSAWQIVGGGLGQFQTRGVVADIVAHGSRVDVAGCFSTVGGLEGAPGAVKAYGVARWDGAGWTAPDDGTKGVGATWFSPAVCGDEGPDAIWDADRQRLVFAGDRLYLGGMVPGAGGVQSQSMAAYDDAGGWIAQGASGLGVAGSIDRVAIGGAGCEVFALGSFTHLGGAATSTRVARFDGAAWAPLAMTLPNDAWCPGLDVAPDGAPVIGCASSAADGAPVGALLRREGEAMVPVVTSPALPTVLAVAHAPSGALFVGGTNAEGEGYVARVDGAAVTFLEDAFDGPVNLLDVQGDDDVIAGGAFAVAGSVAAANIARWDGSAWSAIGEGVPGQVTALRRVGTKVYVSTYDLGMGAYLLGAFDGTSWKELASSAANLTPKPELNFNQIRAVGDALVLVGSAVLDDGSGRGALVYRDGKFSALAGGVGAIGVSDVAVGDGAIWVAGSIAQAGPESSAVPTVGVAVYRAPL